MQEFDDPLSLPVRKKIFDEISVSPGLHFRELQRRTNLAVGSLQYHLDFLEKKHLIRIEKLGKFARYYSIRGEQLGDNQTLMSVLRQPTMRKIALMLIEKGKANNEQIAAYLQLSPSTTSWHLEKMLSTNVLTRTKEGRMSWFTINKPEEAKNLLIKFKGSFFDELVDNFVNTWTEIKI